MTMYRQKYILCFLAILISGVAKYVAQCGTPSINLGADTILCPGQTLLLNATSSGGVYTSYVWNNNSTLPNRTVNSAGVYSVTGTLLGPNVVTNGSFELGATGFTTDYIPGSGGPFGLLSAAGTYAITTSPSLAHNNFSFCADHTPAPGVNMLVVNGASVPSTNVWCQTVNITPNTNYQLSVWISNALNEITVGQLQFSVNGALIGPIFSTSTVGCNWQNFFQIWNSGTNTTANLCILNQNTSASGNDFLLDDISFRPQCTSSDTIVVSYSTNPVVNLGPDTFSCFGDSITLDAQNPGASFLWSNGSTGSTLLVDSTGIVQVTVTNADFCTGTDQINTTFEVPKSAGSDKNETWCVTNPTENLNLYLDASADLGGVWSDVIGTIGSNLVPNGILTLNGLVGQHQAEYIVSGTHCPNDTSTFDFTIHQQPIGLTDTTLSLCNTLGLLLDFTPFVNGVLNDLPPFWVESSVFNSNQFNAATATLDLSDLQGGSYEFSYVSPAQSPCLNDTTRVIINVTENPIINFDANIYRGCNPLSVDFLNQSTFDPSNSSVSWSLGDGSSSNLTTGLTHIYTGATCYDVELSITANNLCSRTLTKPDFICVDPLPIADFDSDVETTFSDDPQVQFTNLSQLNQQNFWSFGDGFSSSEINPNHQFPLGEVGNFSVILIVTSSAGCTDTAQSIIRVQDQLLFYVPNSFTPDGDEFNSIFQPVLTTGFDPASYQMSVYDRWGKLLFSTLDISIGWDGTVDQQLVPQGIYTWRIEFKDQKTDERYVKVGHLNLLR